MLLRCNYFYAGFIGINSTRKSAFYHLACICHAGFIVGKDIKKLEQAQCNNKVSE